MTFALPPLALACLSAAVFTPALAAENPGAHVHGQASMQVAVDGGRIDVIFETPAANLVGFEYKPATGAERIAVEEARQWLERTPLINTADSACRVEQASVSNSHDDHQGHEDHGEHEEEHHDDHGDHTGGHNKHHQQTDASHSEFEVSQLLVCDATSNQNLVTPVLTKYPAITALSVDWVNKDGQGNTRLEAGESRIRLGR